MEPSTPSVLIVEDEGIVARDLQETLAGMGYDAFAVADSGQEALRHAAAHRPDVVLMDVRIKGALDGVATAAMMRDRFDVPVVYLTAHSDDVTLGRAKQTTPYGFLVKPVQSAELRCTIEVSLARHELERRLREKEAWLSATLGSVADGVVSADPELRLTYLNRAAEGLIGRGAGAALGRPVREVLPLFPPPADGETLPIEQAVARREAVGPVEGRLLRPDDSLRYVSSSAAPVVDGDSLKGAVMVLRDVTEERALRATLESMERFASLSKMAAGLAHEVANPLQIVMADAELAERQLHSARARLRQSLPDLEGAMARLGDLAATQEELLEGARKVREVVDELRLVGGPRWANHDAPADLGRVVAWAVRATAQALGSIPLALELEPELPLVRGNEDRIGRVVVNLVLNAAAALKGQTAGERLVTLRAMRHDAVRAAIEVDDNGPGIAPEALGHVFEPFFTTRSEQGGTGLGLAICRSIVESAGGEIAVKSEVGVGTVFQVLLPVSRGATG